MHWAQIGSENGGDKVWHLTDNEKKQYVSSVNLSGKVRHEILYCGIRVLASFSSLFHRAAERDTFVIYTGSEQIKTLKVLSEGLFKYKDLINV